MSMQTEARLMLEESAHERALVEEHIERETGRRMTTYGTDGDHCPQCGHDWKQPHSDDCPHHFTCAIPIGCEAPAAPGRRVCREHAEQYGPLFEAA
jgi:hypothetical protein